MRLRLETFDKISILYVYRTVSFVDANILAAGVSKLATLGRRWIFIDLGRAMLDVPAGEFLKKHAKDFKVNNVDIHWIGNFSELCVYEELTDALAEIGIKEFKTLSDKIDLEMREESLTHLLDARKRMLFEMDTNKRTIESMETEYLETNRNLRAAQTQLINRFLDPVFAELWSEPLAGEMAIAQFEAVLGNKEPPTTISEADSDTDATTVPEQPQAISEPFDPYLPKSLKDMIAQLRLSIKELQKEAKKKILDGKGDRCVSLLLENDVIRERIQEIRDAWIHALESDSRVTDQDFGNGFQPLLQKITEQELLKADTKKKVS